MTHMSPGAREKLKRLQLAFLICGVLALGYSAFVLIDAHFYQKAAALRFQRQTEAPAASRPSVVNPQPVLDGAPVARFEIPRLNLDTVLIEGVTDTDLRHAIGHIPGTAFPGRSGNVGVAGHRDTFFRPLRNIRSGDLITLTTTTATYQYQVESTEVVAPERSDVLNPTKEPHLTLVTCFPFYYVGSAPKRFIIHAREIAPEQPAPPTSSGAGEHPAVTNSPGN